MNIGALLPRHARYRGDHIALVVGSRQFTYRQLNAEVNRLSNALLAAGLRKGDKFTTILPNCLELMVAYWAAAKTGIVIVPASPLLQDAGMATLMTDSDTVLVIADASAPANYAAIDLIVQAEHGPHGLAWLLTWDEAVAEAVGALLGRLQATLASPTRFTKVAFDLGWHLPEMPASLDDLTMDGVDIG